MNLCEVCGNEFIPSLRVCPFCKSKQTKKIPCKKSFRLKEVNLEYGLPLVDTAIARLEQAVRDAKVGGYMVLIFIHGYGSSGKGGKIRTECRKMLAYLKDRGDIADFIPGEEMDSSRSMVRQWLRRFPEIGKNRHIKSSNKGITFVFVI